MVQSVDSFKKEEGKLEISNSFISLTHTQYTHKNKIKLFCQQFQEVVEVGFWLDKFLVFVERKGEMGSGYFGEPNLGNDQRSGSSSSTNSRKGKKGSSDKPKQPQRGLGVAQLEKIRLHSQMGCNYVPTPTPNYPQQEDMRIQTAYSSLSSSFSYSLPSTTSYSLQGHQSIMMNMGEYDRSNIRYGDSQATTNQRWNAGNTFLEAQPGVTRHLLNLEVQDSLKKKKKKDRSDSMGSSSQNSDSNGSQELDLELRLSL